MLAALSVSIRWEILPAPFDDEYLATSCFILVRPFPLDLFTNNKLTGDQQRHLYLPSNSLKRQESSWRQPYVLAAILFLEVSTHRLTQTTLYEHLRPSVVAASCCRRSAPPTGTHSFFTTRFCNAAGIYTPHCRLPATATYSPSAS